MNHRTNSFTLVCGAFMFTTALADGIAHAQLADDPEVDSPLVQPVVEAIEQTGDQQTRITESNALRAYADAILPFDAPASDQSLYAAGHQLYRDNQRLDSLAAFEQLALQTQIKSLKIDALRMVGQINSSLRENESSYMAFHEAYHLIDDDLGPPIIVFSTKSAVISHLRRLAEVTGRTTEAVAASDDEVTLFENSEYTSRHQDALHAAIDIHASAGFNDNALQRLDDLLGIYPDWGKVDGARIWIEVRRRELTGKPWGQCNVDEMLFCSDILNDPTYRYTEGRYGIGLHVAQCASRLYQPDKALQILDAMLVDIDEDRNSLDPEDHRLQGLNEAKGSLLWQKALGLARSNQNTEADQIFVELESNPNLYGTFISQLAQERFDRFPSLTPIAP